MPPPDCVIVTPTGPTGRVSNEDGLTELGRRGYTYWKVAVPPGKPPHRTDVAAVAFQNGFAGVFWIDPDVLFNPDDVDRLRGYDLPFVCGLYPHAGRRAFACEFLPGTASVTFGRAGGLTEVRAAGLGFALVRRAVYDSVRGLISPAGETDPDFAFCAMARQAGVKIVADTAVRLYRMGPYPYSWEEAGREPERCHTYTFHLPTADPIPASSTKPAAPSGVALKPTAVPRNPLRGEARPLPLGFPRLAAYVVTYPANRESLALTLDSLRRSDWGEEPTVIEQQEAPSKAGGPRNYKRALERAAADGCDFALILEDDVRAARHIRHNLSTVPLVARDQCDYLSLFVPDLMADPWERTETHLGYRVAKPRYSGPDEMWEKHRIWGSQAYLLSRRFVLLAVDRWDALTAGQDARVMSLCGEYRLPPFYTAPCLVDHVPLKTAYGTVATYAPDFDPDFRLELGPGFQPPESIPGWVTAAEGKQLWESAAGRDVLELGTGAGRSTVCLGQSARRVVTVDVNDQAEAAEWIRRYGLDGRVEFRRGDAATVCEGLAGRFGLVFVDTERDAGTLSRHVEVVLPLIDAGGLLAIHGYPDPTWPWVRQVVDGFAGKPGWKRVAQVNYLGVFRT